MKNFHQVYPLFQQRILEIDLLVNKHLALTKTTSNEQLLCFDIKKLVEELKSILEKNLAVTNVNFQEIVRQLYNQDNSIEAVQLVVQIKDCERYSRVAYQQIPLYQFNHQSKK